MEGLKGKVVVCTGAGRRNGLGLDGGGADEPQFLDALDE